jgi:hypothetical protein
MAWTDANSSMIKDFNYDSDVSMLHVRFRGGQVYSFRDVPPETAAEFAAAPSKGKYFHNNLRDQFKAI